MHVFENDTKWGICMALNYNKITYIVIIDALVFFLSATLLEICMAFIT